MTSARWPKATRPDPRAEEAAQLELVTGPAAPSARPKAVAAAAEYAATFAGAAREHGLDRARRSDPLLHDALVKAIEQLVWRGGQWTADDVVERVPGAAGNAIGAAIRAASQTGLCMKTGQHVRSRRVGNHGRELAVWTRKVPA